MTNSLLRASVLSLVLFIGGCEAGASEPAPASHEASGQAAHHTSGAGQGAAAHATASADHGMNMAAGEAQRPDFLHTELVVLKDAPPVPPAFTAALDLSLDDYFALSASFAADDPGAVKTRAAAMLGKVEALDARGLEPEAARAWASHREVLRASLHQLLQAEDLGTRREHFSHVSEAMYCAIRSFGGVNRTVEVVQCPMAFGDIGAVWLAPDKTIANPYLGAAMASCGALEETLSQR